MVCRRHGNIGDFTKISILANFNPKPITLIGIREVQGPVFRKPINANSRLKVNQGFHFVR